MSLELETDQERDERERDELRVREWEREQVRTALEAQESDLEHFRISQTELDRSRREAAILRAATKIVAEQEGSISTDKAELVFASRELFRTFVESSRIYDDDPCAFCGADPSSRGKR